MVTDTTLASDNPFTFQKESFKKNIKVTMIINKIRDEKL